MPKLALDWPDRTETLRYLGFRGVAIDSRTDAALAVAIREVHDCAAPRAVHAFTALSGDAQPLGVHLRFEGQAVRRHLAGCERCALLAVTLGAGIDSLIRKAQAIDLAYAVLLDAAANALIEQACDQAQQDIARAACEPYHTCRFSPGYCDLPLATQTDLLRVLDAQRAIGLAATAHSLLSPRKSVTAIIGLSHTPLAGRAVSCLQCGLFRTCQYRKGGGSCDATGKTDQP